MGNKKFYWKALDEDGRVIYGSGEFPQLSEVRRELFSQGYYPLRIRPKKNILRSVESSWDRLNKQMDRRRIWANLSKRLSLLLQAGIPLVQAIAILSETETKGRIRSSAWDAVKERIDGGDEFSEAIEEFIPSPTPFIQAMIRAGEQAGTLPETLAEISAALEAEDSFRRKLVNAYSYPLFLAFLSLGVIYALSVLVLPVYERIFQSLETELPFLTRVIFICSRLIPLIILGFAFLALGAVFVLRMRYPEVWREKWHGWLGHVPLLGRLYQLNDWFQFSRILGTLLDAGIPLMDALHLTSGTVRQYEMKRMITELIRAVREGRRLAPVLRMNRHFPREASQMLAVGEESGQLSEMLHSMAQVFRLDLEKQMETLPRILGPVLIVTLSAIIGTVAIGVLLPVFEVGTHLE